ncbi:hypothetical protein TIFTF001_034759 [Ficus carica]|uniref:Uncharacterized protein n=1 Tax=Ficus carica TaxID=3494 RepID=A0AA88E106_FICCA|nr:hypothetical protein TIFTF001_034759 [Ficus carica]
MSTPLKFSLTVFTNSEKSSISDRILASNSLTQSRCADFKVAICSSCCSFLIDRLTALSVVGAPTKSQRFEMVVRNVESLAGGESSGTMSGESDPTVKSKGCFTCGGPHMAKNCPSKVKLSAIFAAEAARETAGVADDDEDVARTTALQIVCDGGVSGAYGKGRVRSVMVRTIEWLRGWLHERECSGADSVDFQVARVTLCCVGADRRMATWVAKWTRMQRPMVQDWGLGGELHGQGWLGIGAKAVNSMGKTLWLAMRRRASMLDLDSSPASSPTHHWDRGAKTWVARHSGKTRQRCWRGSAHGGNDQDQGLVSVVRRGPACTQTDQRVCGRVKTHAQR